MKMIITFFSCFSTLKTAVVTLSLSVARLLEGTEVDGRHVLSGTCTKHNNKCTCMAHTHVAVTHSSKIPCQKIDVIYFNVCLNDS